MACRTVPPTFTITMSSSTANNLALSTEVIYTCTGNFVIAPGDNNFNYICQAKTHPTYEAEWVLKAGEPASPTCAGNHYIASMSLNFIAAVAIDAWIETQL